ncbi:hypothetical protein ANN_08773 [Periplaneta americana]|uniref:Uncharacterized protein n=1 Tax=Periplaneta americana TaxID=6978 RepID=A0ABQ8T3R4_PERAM|nr:hypothetical protein ANN_08773 [Periplaneta americana]
MQCYVSDRVVGFGGAVDCGNLRRFGAKVFLTLCNMTKTSKEKVQAFRAKLSDVKKKEIREKDRLHKASERSKRSKKQIAIDREKARISMRKLRALRKSQVKQSEVPNNGDPEEISSPSKTAYGSNLSLYKAVSRAKLALPKSPRKKKAVVRKLAKSFGIAEDKNKVIRGTPALINEAKERVIEFYQRDDISCMTPGRKDFINVTNDDGTKSKVQRRYLLYSIRECFELFQADNVDLLPITDFMVCDIGNSECVNRKCSICTHKVETLLATTDEDTLSEPLQYHQWIRDSEGKMIKRCIEDSTVNDALKALTVMSPKYLFHCYVKKKQSTYFRMLLDNASDTEVLLQVDFSENYSIIHQNEVQSAHWSHDQVTLFTACFWYKDKVKSYVIVSDYMTHDKYAVAQFVNVLVDELKSFAPNVRILNIFSDGAAQHFKQRFTLSLATTAPVPINWHFFATSHGKGAVNGIGGTVKRNVFDGVRAGRFDPIDAKSFSECARDVSGKTTILFISRNDIENKKKDLDILWNGIEKLPDIHKLHCIRAQQPFVAKISLISEEEGSLFAFKTEAFHDVNPTVTPTENSKEPVCHIKCENWYAVDWPRFQYWFIGRTISVEEDKIKFQFLHQKNPELNQFEEVNDIAYADPDNIFYCLSEPPYPMSSTRSRYLKISLLLVILYGCETWTLTLREEQKLRVFENKVLRKIFGAKRDEVTGEWRKLHNAELHAFFSSPDIMRNIKFRRLKWAGYVARMGESRNAYRVLVGRPEGKRPLGRSRRRWEDNIKMDLRAVGYDDRDWINLA